MFSVIKEFEFAAAHHLTKYNGKCENPHGHNYVLRVKVSAATLTEDDLVIDFTELKDIVKKYVLNELDHTDLNDKFTNPSCEMVAKWIFDTLKPHLAICEVGLWETSTSWVLYNEA